MYTRLDRTHRALPVLLGAIHNGQRWSTFALGFISSILWANAHNLLGAFPLTVIAIAYLAYQSAHRPPRKELFKAVLLAVAFLFWGANQLWPNCAQATLYNDFAIALFVLYVFLVMIGMAVVVARRILCRELRELPVQEITIF